MTTTSAHKIKPLALVGGAVLAALFTSLLVGRLCKPRNCKQADVAIEDWEAEGGNVQPPISVGN